MEGFFFAILGNIFYNLQHLHIEEFRLECVSNRVYGRELKLHPHVQTCSLVSVKCSVKGQVSWHSPWQLQKKSPCRRAAYDPTLVANLAIALLTVHHGNNPAIPCDPHNAGKRRGHMTSCLLLDSEVEGSIRSMNGDFKASRRGECIYRQGWR